MRGSMKLARAVILFAGLGGIALVAGFVAFAASVADTRAPADVRAEGIVVLESLRLETRHTHGTGCTLASAIAVGLAQGMAPLPAINRARAYLVEAIRHAPGLGSGHGPLGHMHVLRPPTK